MNNQEDQKNVGVVFQFIDDELLTTMSATCQLSFRDPELP